MKKTFKWNPVTFIKNVLSLMLFLLIIWMVVSWFQIVLFNTEMNPYEHYSNWNFWLFFLQFPK